MAGMKTHIREYCGRNRALAEAITNAYMAIFEDGANQMQQIDSAAKRNGLSVKAPVNWNRKPGVVQYKVGDKVYFITPDCEIYDIDRNRISMNDFRKLIDGKDAVSHSIEGTNLFVTSKGKRCDKLGNELDDANALNALDTQLKNPIKNTAQAKFIVSLSSGGNKQSSGQADTKSSQSDANSSVPATEAPAKKAEPADAAQADANGSAPGAGTPAEKGENENTARADAARAPIVNKKRTRVVQKAKGDMIRGLFNNKKFNKQEVERLQTSLNNVLKGTAGWEPLVVDGKIGPKTRAAIKKYVGNNRLPTPKNFTAMLNLCSAINNEASANDYKGNGNSAVASKGNGQGDNKPVRNAVAAVEHPKYVTGEPQEAANREVAARARELYGKLHKDYPTKSKDELYREALTAASAEWQKAHPGDTGLRSAGMYGKWPSDWSKEQQAGANKLTEMYMKKHPDSSEAKARMTVLNSIDRNGYEKYALKYSLPGAGQQVAGDAARHKQSAGGQQVANKLAVRDATKKETPYKNGKRTEFSASMSGAIDHDSPEFKRLLAEVKASHRGQPGDDYIDNQKAELMYRTLMARNAAGGNT